MPFIAIAIVALLALGGGASVAANSSLPGDALYGVKVGINEKIETAFAFSDEARAEANLKDIEERRDEGQKLQAQGKLTADARAGLNANIDAHAKAFNDALAKVQAGGNAQASAQLEAKLQTALSAATSANASANANANASSSSQGTAAGSANDDGTADQGHGDVNVNTNGGIRVGY